MDILLAHALAFLEMTFIFVGFCLLHSQRKSLGPAAFYMMLGLVFFLMQLVYAADLRVEGPDCLWFAWSYKLSSTVFFMPCLAALLLIYVTEGTLAIQRIIIGLLIFFGVFYYLEDLTRLQCVWQMYSLSPGLAPETLEFLLNRCKNGLLAALLAQTADLFLLPIVFTRLRNWSWHYLPAFFGTLMAAQLTDALVYALVESRAQSYWLMEFNNEFVVRSLAALWFSFLLMIYLYKIEHQRPQNEKKPLEIIFAFLGSYGRSLALEKNLLEWEGRYKQLVEHANALVALVDSSGRLMECNPATARMLKRREPRELSGLDFFALVQEEKECRAFFANAWEGKQLDQQLVVTMVATDKSKVNIALTVSPMEFRGLPVLVLFGRDITGEMHLAEERALLQEQLAHSQRLESLGKLAGGVAHDFNNYVHAILGHLDVINMIYAVDDPKIKQHLGKIETVAEQAARLTGQLLGFARKGKYQEVTLDLQKLLEKSVELFVLSTKRPIRLLQNYTRKDCLIRGDQLQLQQVILNLLINAKDAMPLEESFEPVIEITLGVASECPVKPKPVALPPEGFDPANFYFIMIRDNGLGMDRTTLHRIFEPFFTTKPVGQGTGMGLSMVYGTITHHHGTVQVLSRVGKGSTFLIYLPRVAVSPAEEVGTIAEA